MGRSSLAIVGAAIVAMALATVQAPLTHLHVAEGSHRHGDGATHAHQPQLHAHLASHGPVRARVPLPETGIGDVPHDHDGVVSLDTMLTELPSSALGSATVDRVATTSPAAIAGDRLPAQEARAHGPPLARSVRDRAPPVLT